MGVQDNDFGQQGLLNKRVSKALASVAIASTFMLGAWALTGTAAISGGETRTISLYHQHTRESVNVTYMVNGRYVPSAMRQINYVLRDWRRNKTITIDPRTIDLVWELHADLGSRQPVRIVCGYRSPATNSFLRRIGRHVAKASQHMKGKAIDFFFADVPLAKIRNSALARGVGGVGFYSGRNGFLHVDSGNVRHWGIRGGNIGSMVADGRKYVGARIRNGGGMDTTMVASTEPDKKSGGLIGWLFKSSAPKASPEVIAAAAVASPDASSEGDGLDDGEMAAMSADASAASLAATKGKKAAPPKIEPTPEMVADAPAAEPTKVAAALVPAPSKPTISSKSSGALAALASSASVESLGEDKPTLKVAAPTPVVAEMPMVPKPRFRPVVVREMAEARVQDVIIAPVSAAPDDQTWVSKKPSKVADPMAKNIAHALIGEDGTTVSADGKSDLFDSLADLRSNDTIQESPVLASAAQPSTGWLSALFSNASAAANPEGEKIALAGSVSDVMPAAKALGPDGTAEVIDVQQSASGKEDLQTINRDGKSNMEPIRLRLTSR